MRKNMSIQGHKMIPIQLWFSSSNYLIYLMIFEKLQSSSSSSSSTFFTEDCQWIQKFVFLLLPNEQYWLTIAFKMMVFTGHTLEKLTHGNKRAEKIRRYIVCFGLDL
ncbi:hypothetical protein ACJX0J_016144, partial [Zea mays]